MGDVTEKLLTPEEVAERLAVTPQAVKNWLRDGRMKGFKVGSLWRLREEDLQDFLKAGRQG